jgi:subtilisin family serine protease
VPITTSLNPTPDQLILAVLYAYEKGADVIHLPRGVSTAWTSDAGEYDNPGLSVKSEDDVAQWQAFETLLFAVSGTVPVVCAAGNSGESQLSYPANLSLEDKGDNGIISVGAISSAGFRSSYSNYGEGLSLVAPSDDASAFNENQIRLNEAGRRYQTHDYAGYIEGGLPRIELSRRALLATDIPGRAGYAGYAPLGYDQDDDSVAHAYDPLQGAFTLFGGTSGASSLVAGVTALLTRRAKIAGKRLSGPQLKDILVATCKNNTETLKPDNINGQNPPPELRSLFGGGLVDAGAAIAAVS